MFVIIITALALLLAVLALIATIRDRQWHRESAHPSFFNQSHSHPDV